MRTVWVLAALGAAMVQAALAEDAFDRSQRLGEQINDTLKRSTARRELDIQRAETERALDEIRRDTQRMQDELSRQRRF